MNDADRVENAENQGVVETTALEAIENAQISQQIATAKRWPRQIHKVKQEIMSLATLDEETAAACFYTLPRGGKSIQGPGVRLAEIALHCFGNLRAQTRVIETEINGPAPHVTIQAVCADLEKNVAVSIEKRRRIVGKSQWRDGQKVGNKPPDEDDINLATNAGSAIAFRDAVFKVIPGALIKPAYEAAKKVAIGSAETLAVRRATAIERIAKMGVTPPRILAAVGKTAVDEVDLNDLETLFGLYTACKDGQTTVDEAFPAPAKPVTLGNAALAEKLGAKPKAPATTEAPEEAKPADSDTPSNIVTGRVEDVVKKQGTKNGRDYTRYEVLIAGKNYSTINTLVGETAEALLDQDAKATVEQNGKYWNLIAIGPRDVAEKAVDTPANSEEQPREIEEELPFN